MIDGYTSLFLLPGNRTNRANLQALRIFTLAAGVSGIVQIAIQAAPRTRPFIAKEKITMDFDTGEKGANRAIVKVCARDFTAMATRAARSLGNQNPL